MLTAIHPGTLEKFNTFGDLLRFLRRRAGLTQLELAVEVGYSDTQISRLEQNQRLPDLPILEARFVPALGIEDQPAVAEKLLELAGSVRREDAPVPGLCPYKGLNYFDEADADLFVGREELTADLIERLLALAAGGGVRLLAVVGASGSGKSSLVRAGLVPALRRHSGSADWDIHILTPTAHPLHSLAETLTTCSPSLRDTAALIDDMAQEPRSLQLYARRSLGTRDGRFLLLVVDQFEELFAHCRSEAERAGFIDNLMTAAEAASGPVLVVITLRADFYAHCAAYGGLRRALTANQQYIGSMCDDELRRMIEESAGRGRWEFEPGLVDLLLHDAGQEPGALPLLSHALYETWQRRRGRTMTFSGYASCNGVRGAIAETAETVFNDQFTPQQQAIARRIFLRLTELGEKSTMADTRRRATFSELVLKPEETETTHAVLKALADARLITTGEDTAEVAHEALIREWPTLRGWLEENREELRLHRQLTEAAQEWQEAGRDPGMLYRGARLAQAREWAAAQEAEMNALEQEFLGQSITGSEREAAEREAQRRRELAATQRLAEAEARRAEEQARAAGLLRRRAYLLAGAFTAALLLAALASFFWAQTRQAAAVAQENERIAFARELAAASVSRLGDDPELSILLALQAIETTSPKGASPEAEEALHQALLASHVRSSWSIDDGTYAGGSFKVIAYSPDGKRLITGGEDGQVRVWDPTTGQELPISTIQCASEVYSLAISPDSTRLAVGSVGSIQVYDLPSGQLLHSLMGHKGPVTDIVFSQDGQMLLSGSNDAAAFLWNVAGERKMQELSGTNGPVVKVTFQLQVSGQDFAAITQNAQGKLSLWNSAAGRPMWSIDGSGPLAVSPDGSTMAAVGKDGRIVNIWDTAVDLSGDHTLPRIVARMSGSADAVNNLVYSQDGAYLATVSRDGLARIWDAASGQEMLSLAGHHAPIQAVAFSPDGRHLATGDDDGSMRIWDIGPGQELFSLSAEAALPRNSSQEFQGPVFSPDGKLLYALVTELESENPSGSHVRVADAANGRGLRTLAGETDLHDDWPATGMALSPDGRLLAVAYGNGDVRVVDSSTDEQLLAFSVPTQALDLAFSPDGRWLAVPGSRNSVQMWDVAGGEPILALTIPSGTLLDLAFNPAGTRLATATGHQRSYIWNLSNGEAEFKAPVIGNTAVAYSADGSRLAFGSEDGSVVVRDTATGEKVLSLSGHASGISALAFSPDGSRLATSGGDGTLRLWDLGSGRELLTLPGGGDLAFSPDGRLLAAVNSSGASISVHVLPLEELIALAKSRLTRDLTQEECRGYLHLEKCPTKS